MARPARRGLFLAAAALIAVPIVSLGASTRTADTRAFNLSLGGSPIDPAGEEAPHPITRVATSTTTASPSTVAPPPQTSTTAQPVPAIRSRPAVAMQRPQPTSTISTTFGCAAALSYLEAHANPAARLECPAWAGGHQAETCYHAPPTCGSQDFVIRIWDPCPAAYMNEAWNSNHLGGPFDPYGYCH